MNLSMGQFGNAEVAFAYPGQRIPAELLIEFELLRMTERPPALLADWVARLERGLRRDAAPKAWTVLRVSPNMERKVAAALGPKSRENPHGAGLTVHVPLERYRPKNGWRPRHRPLMPGYVFAYLRDDDDLDLARGNYAVREVMCREGHPVRVPAEVIGWMVFLEAFRAFDVAIDAKPVRRGGRRSAPLRNWKKGQRVLIADGPFAGFIGEVMKADRADRMELMVDIFGRATLVAMDEGMLEGWDE